MHYTLFSVHSSVYINTANYIGGGRGVCHYPGRKNTAQQGPGTLYTTKVNLCKGFWSNPSLKETEEKKHFCLLDYLKKTRGKLKNARSANNKIIRE